MKKKVFGRRFKRDRNERKALFRSLITSLVVKGKIETTEEKAKAVKGDVDKMITLAKKGQRGLSEYIFPNAMEKLTEVLPAFSSRNSGYTRLVRKGKRLSDNATMVVMEWVDLAEARNQKASPKKQKAPKKVTKKESKIVKSKPVAKKIVKKETKNVKK